MVWGHLHGLGLAYTGEYLTLWHVSGVCDDACYALPSLGASPRAVLIDLSIFFFVTLYVRTVVEVVKP